MKTAKEMKEAAWKNNIHHWHIHKCSTCDYDRGFIFHFREDEVIYDHGCYCTRSKSCWKSRWEMVAKHFNEQKNPFTMEGYRKYWGFEENE